ncbi:MAG: DUF4340 domain-containing protein [Oscillospiraceae bacterium]|nr:DUF4340 domain-containing protein [Oscillospiraceae bacterium]
MKKNIRLIIIICVIAAVLAGAVLVLMKTAPQDEEQEDTAEEVTTLLLYDKAPNDIAKLTIENEGGTYELVRVGDGDDAKWTVMDIANLPLSSSVMTRLLDNSASLTAQQTVSEAPEDISIYGLDAPSATFTAEFSDSAKTVKKLLIGNLTPEETKRYVMLEGDPKVYTVFNTALNCFLQDKYALINKTVFSAQMAASADDTTDYTRINKLTVSRADLDYDIVIEYDVRLDDDSSMVGNSSTYVMSEPVFRDLNPETSSSVTDGIFGLTASDLAVLNPNEEDIAASGMDEPAAEVTAEVNGGSSLHFKIGNEFINEEGKKDGRYVLVDGINIIYIFSESSLPWLTVKPLDIVTTMYTSNYVYDLDMLNITCDGKKMKFSITGSSDDFAVTLNGAAVDGDAFKNLYQFILRAPSSELYFEDVSAEPSLTVEIVTRDGGGDLIEFISDGNRRAVVRLNGRSEYICQQSYVDRFIKNLELFENGEEIVLNW